MKTKLIIMVAIIIVLCTVLYLKSNETKNWTNYTNKVWGFEFKYPSEKFGLTDGLSDYGLVPSEDFKEGGILIFERPNKEKVEDEFLFVINIIKQPREGDDKIFTDPKEALRKYIGFETPGMSVASSKFLGYDAAKFEYPSNKSLVRGYLIIHENNYIYAIYWDKSHPEFEKIINTFKFIK